MKTFRAELVADNKLVDYMEFETDSKEMAFKYAVARFEKAYPFHTKKAKFNITEVNAMHFGGSKTQECNDCGSRLIEDGQCLTCDSTDIKEI